MLTELIDELSISNDKKLNGFDPKKIKLAS